MKINDFISKLLKYIMKKINYQGFMNLREEYKLKPYAVIKEYMDNCENSLFWYC